MKRKRKNKEQEKNIFIHGNISNEIPGKSLRYYFWKYYLLN
jgi:hypothetical protein